MGRCLRPAWNVTSIVTFAPGLPRTSAHGREHGDPRGHLLRGSKRGPTSAPTGWSWPQPPAPSSPMPVSGRPEKRFWPGVYTPVNTRFYTFLQCTGRRSRREEKPRNLGISRVFGVVYEKVGFVLRNRGLGVQIPPGAPRPLTKRALMEGDQRVFLPNGVQLPPDGLFGRPKSALFETHGSETLEIVDAEAFTGCGVMKNAESPDSRRRELTQGFPVSDV